MKKSIIIVGRESKSTSIIYNFLVKEFDIPLVIIEKPKDKFSFYINRIKKLGFLKVVGQLLFGFLVFFVLSPLSKKRINEILFKNDLSIKKIPDQLIKRVKSINNSKSRDFLNNNQSDIVIVSGTRIINSKTLDSCQKKFINIHAGITPKYRGVHGGYWAIVNNDSSNCGVTVHNVDKGIDTGLILAQDIIKYENTDNFCTYPYLQLFAGLKLLNKILLNIFSNKETSKKLVIDKKLDSKLYYHPTIYQYMYYYFLKGFK